MKWIVIALLFLCAACTIHVERTFIEGQGNQITEDEKTEQNSNVNANAEIPLWR